VIVLSVDLMIDPTIMMERPFLQDRRGVIFVWSAIPSAHYQN
jgi:hypothetical protein